MKLLVIVIVLCLNIQVNYTVYLSRRMKTYDIWIAAVREDWLNFQRLTGRNYISSEELKRRFYIFLYNRIKVEQHNLLYKLGLYTYTMELNEYADLTAEEFNELMIGFVKNFMPTMDNGKSYDMMQNHDENKTPDNSLDWNERGAVTSVKHQGVCAASWAFSAVGALEGQHYLSTGDLESLSVQNLIDCSSLYGNAGCKTGAPKLAFQFIKDNEGIETDRLYPYEADAYICRFNPKHSVVKISGYVNLPAHNEDVLKHAVFNVGPISAVIDAQPEGLQFYAHGIYSDSKCSSKVVNHGVLVVGYGTTNAGNDYWLIKNSWGAGWGMDGYFRLARSKNNTCGIATSTSYPVIE